MTATVKTYHFNRNITAKITCDKKGTYTLIIYNDNNELIQNNDILLKKTYYAMIDAKNAPYRYMKKEMLYQIS